MKDMDMSMTPGLELPNDQNPKPRAPIHYGNQYVPHPTNAQAKLVSRDAIMNAVNKGK